MLRRVGFRAFELLLLKIRILYQGLWKIEASLWPMYVVTHTTRSQSKVARHVVPGQAAEACPSNSAVVPRGSCRRRPPLPDSFAPRCPWGVPSVDREPEE